MVASASISISMVTGLPGSPPSGGGKHSPVDGCGWGVLIV